MNGGAALRSLRALLLCSVAAAALARPACAAVPRPVVFVPLDDRPVTYQLPLLLGRIAGVPVVAPPAAMLGHYLQPGSPEQIIAWLNGRSPKNAAAYVISSDMLVYGGLLASRVPGTTYADAFFRLRELQQLRREHPAAWIAVFGTVMRLAPTGIPAIGPAQGYFAAGPIWQYLWEYAKLHDPLLPNEEADAQRLRALAGPAFDEYLADRARDLAVDRLLVADAATVLDRVVLGQDDAGPVGIDVPDRLALDAQIAQQGSASRADIEPGADELGMALVARALAGEAGWTPRVAVRYSAPGGALAQDPLEYGPISVAIDRLVMLCGGVESEISPQIVLFVRVPGTTQAQDAALIEAMRAQESSGRSVALADLSFLDGGGNPGYAEQSTFARLILADGIASRLTAYASWNTNANTVGTALAEAVAAGAGRRLGTYDALAHREFTFMRFVDDYAFHDEVRPVLNAQLEARGVDHMLLLPPDVASVALENRSLLWSDAQAILGQLYPGYHIAAMTISLPWNRTFETKIDVGLAPNLFGQAEVPAPGGE
jgi:hypothetical protein